MTGRPHLQTFGAANNFQMPIAQPPAPHPSLELLRQTRGAFPARGSAWQSWGLGSVCGLGALSWFGVLRFWADPKLSWPGWLSDPCEVNDTGELFFLILFPALDSFLFVHSPLWAGAVKPMNPFQRTVQTHGIPPALVLIDCLVVWSVALSVAWVRPSAGQLVWWICWDLC